MFKVVFSAHETGKYRWLDRMITFKSAFYLRLGYNKSCTKFSPEHVWVHYCRKTLYWICTFLKSLGMMAGLLYEKGLYSGKRVLYTREGALRHGYGDKIYIQQMEFFYFMCVQTI